MMILSFFITSITFILFSKSLHLKPVPPWASEMRLLTFCFWKESSFGLLIKKSSISSILSKILSIMASMKNNIDSTSSVEDDTKAVATLSLLDLPELVLECILEKLPPERLCTMASVSRSLRDRCISDYFWEKHMKQKWGRIIGPAAYREWQYHIATRNDSCSHKQGKEKEVLRYLISLLPFNRICSTVEDGSKLREKSLPVDSIMSWYLALESGRFRFPAQVYNRENGHVGFMLSCYDAELRYDSRTDSFQARYPPHGRREIALENGVSCDRIRAPPVDTPPHDLHISDCLNDLRLGDHIELQWRRNKEFPYGWWYGIVGHLELCDGNEIYCHCHNSDMVALEFNQYSPGSRWRRTIINRKDHTEEGNEADGFYGGIRKLYKNEEISMWKYLWPNEVLE